MILIRIPYNIDYVNLKDYIVKLCNENKIKIKNYDVNIDLEFINNFTSDKFVEVKQFVENKNGKLLSDTYINFDHPLLLQCNNNHNWTASYHTIKAGHWCPYCSKCAKLTIEKMQEYAKLKNGICLSSIYKNNSTKLTWQCEKGHIWETIPKVIMNGHWCMKCHNQK